MFDWTDFSGFEITLIILLTALWALSIALYGKVSYLVRLKEVELRKNGVIEPD